MKVINIKNVIYLLFLSNLNTYSNTIQNNFCCDSVLIKLKSLCKNDSIVEAKYIYENSTESLKFKRFIELVKCLSEKELIELITTNDNNVVITYAYMGLKIKGNKNADMTYVKFFKPIKYLNGDLLSVYSEPQRFIDYTNKNLKRLQYIYLKY